MTMGFMQLTRPNSDHVSMQDQNLASGEDQ